MATRAPKFAPHDYATDLTKSGDWCSDRSLLYSWTGTHWHAQPDSESSSVAYHWIVRRSKEHAAPENAARAVKSALMFLPALPDPALDSNLVVVPCRNGYVHISKTGEPVLHPAAREFGLQHVLACDYDPAVTNSPLFDAFLSRAVPCPDVRARVQEYIGYTLMSDTRFQLAQLWLGEGANGKGVLANIIQAMHGAVAAVRLDDLAGFKLSGLVGASLVYCDEVPKGRIDEQMLKSLIAGERVQVDRKYAQPLSLRIKGKWVVLGNHVPVVTDHSVGFWRRWDLIPFGETVPLRERDPLLCDKIIKTELAAVLNWALAGLQRLLVREGFDHNLPKAMQKLANSAKSESNSILAWQQDVDLVLVPGGATPQRKAALYVGYREWCTANGLQSFSAVKWLQGLERHFGDQLLLKRRRDKPSDHPDWFINLVPGALHVPTQLSIAA